MVTGNRTIRDKGLGHPPGEPPRSAKVLFAGDGNLEWIIRGRRENKFQLLPQDNLPCQGLWFIPLTSLLLSFPSERSHLEFWRSCSPNFYQVVDLSTEGVDYNGCCNALPMIRIRADDLIHPICWECSQQTSLGCQPSSGTTSAEDSPLIPSLQLPSNGQFNPMSG